MRFKILVVAALLAAITVFFLLPAESVKATSNDPPGHCTKDVQYDFSPPDGFWRSEYLWAVERLSFDPRGTPIAFTYHYVKSEKYRLNRDTFEVETIVKDVGYQLCYIDGRKVTYL